MPNVIQKKEAVIVWKVGLEVLVLSLALQESLARTAITDVTVWRNIKRHAVILKTERVFVSLAILG